LTLLRCGAQELEALRERAKVREHDSQMLIESEKVIERERERQRERERERGGG
jgi:hypothetical protein